jgi:hypothetical protein
MKTVESRDERMRVTFDVGMIVLEDRQEEFGLRVADGFDDESVVARKVKEGSRLAW